MDERAALAAIDEAALLADAATLVRVPSVSGDERPAVELVCAQAQRLGLEAVLEEEDLEALRSDPGHPGEEAERSELVNARIRLHAGDGSRRLALCGHVDVVDPGTVPWSGGDPFSGRIADGALHGRGSVDMKAAVVAALHALAAARATGVEVDCDLLAVAAEEDGGLGAFAALRRDAGYAGCVVVEPTSFAVVCAQAGAITFRGTVEGVAAHAAQRLEGVSAIDRYVPVHAALAAHETTVNAGVADPLMAALPLPYPLSVGRVSGGTWSSSVPDALEFEGRAPVRIGESVADARAAVEAAVASADPDGAVRLEWSGGSFASARTRDDAPIARLVREAARAELGADPGLGGVAWGADMRLFAAAGIDTVMWGTPTIARAHAVDEHVFTADVVRLARGLVRLLVRWSEEADGGSSRRHRYPEPCSG